MITALKQFFTDVSKEMKKVNWPSKEQLRESTSVVVVTCVVLGAIVFLVDQAMTRAMALVYGG